MDEKQQQALTDLARIQASDVQAHLYNKIAQRKSKHRDYEPYDGNNGRVNRALELYRTKKLKSGGVHLDAGGGIGDLGFVLRKEGLFEETITLDISVVNLAAAESKGNAPLLGNIDLQGIDREDLSVNAISALDFIEHIIDPESFARECYRVLELGGEVFINTPNIQFFQHIEQLINGSFPHTSGDREVYHGGHLAFYTFRDLCEIFQSAGFDACKMFKDDEGYVDPPQEYIKKLNPISQQEFVNACMRFGNPNLLFSALKPD